MSLNIAQLNTDLSTLTLEKCKLVEIDYQTFKSLYEHQIIEGFLCYDSGKPGVTAIVRNPEKRKNTTAKKIFNELLRINIFEEREIKGIEIGYLRVLVGKFNKAHGRYFSVRKDNGKCLVFENFWKRKRVTLNERINFEWVHDRLGDVLSAMPLDTDEVEVESDIDEVEQDIEGDLI